MGLTPRADVPSHRSHAPLSFPPHVIALASLYTSAILLLENAQPHGSSAIDDEDDERKKVVKELGNAGSWESQYNTTKDQIDGKFPLLPLESCIAHL